jgi:hypothetical protein
MKVCLTNTSANQNGDLHIKNVLSWSAVGTVDSHDRKIAAHAVRVKLNEISTGSPERFVFLILFPTLHGGLCKCSHNGWTGSHTLAKSLCPIADLTDVNRNVGILWGRCDGELDCHLSLSIMVERVNDTNRMPLPARDIRNLDEQPLASRVLEAGLHDTKLHGTCHR